MFRVINKPLIIREDDGYAFEGPHRKQVSHRVRRDIHQQFFHQLRIEYVVRRSPFSSLHTSALLFHEVAPLFAGFGNAFQPPIPLVQIRQSVEDCFIGLRT